MAARRLYDPRTSSQSQARSTPPAITGTPKLAASEGVARKTTTDARTRKYPTSSARRSSGPMFRDELYRGARTPIKQASLQQIGAGQAGTHALHSSLFFGARAETNAPAG